MEPAQVDLEALQFLIEVDQDLVELRLPLVVLLFLVVHQPLVALGKYLDPLLQQHLVSWLQQNVYFRNTMKYCLTET